MRRRPPAACQRIAASRSRARLGRCEANGNTAPPAAPTAKVNVEVFYVHPDHLGTPRVITASTALAATTGTGITSAQTVNKAVWRWDSDPFGSNATANSAPNENPNTLSQVVGTATLPYLFGFDLALPGQKRDRETGKHYNYFRDYDPSIGRYAESDPIGLGGGFSTFAYVDLQPINGSDPYGLKGGPGPQPVPPPLTRVPPDWRRPTQPRERYPFIKPPPVKLCRTYICYYCSPETPTTCTANDPDGARCRRYLVSAENSGAYVSDPSNSLNNCVCIDDFRFDKLPRTER